MGYNIPINTDHSPIYFQINIPRDDKNTQVTRKLNSTHQTAVTKYIQYKYSRMKAENLFNKIDSLRTCPMDQSSINYIDQRVTQISLEAEHQLPTYRDTGWNTQIPQLKQSMKKINQKLKTEMKQTPKDTNQITTLLSKKKHIIKMFKLQTTQGYTIRHSEISQRITELQNDSTANKEKINHLRKLLHVEKTRLLFKKIHSQISQNTATNTSLQIQRKDGSVEDIINPTTIG
jgi:hypothetical protein